MTNQILLNNEVYYPEENELPYLITYGKKAGGSHFSVTLISDLFLHGSKILFLTAYPMAKDNFLEQIKGSESKVSYVTHVSQLNTNAQAIILESGNEKLYLEAFQGLKDLQDRVVLIKNMEVFSNLVINLSLKLQKVVLSGDIDSCSTKKLILKKRFKTFVVFTKPDVALFTKIPNLEKYSGYLFSDAKNGIVKII